MNYLDSYDGDVIKRNIIYSPESETSYSENLPTPLLINFILSLIIIAIAIFNYKVDKWNKSLDTLIFLITGSIGILIIYLWFFSNHFEELETKVSALLYPKIMSINSANFDFPACNFTAKNLYIPKSSIIYSQVSI